MVADVFEKPSFMSAQVSQALFGEVVEVLDEKENWYKIKQWDGYESWIHQFYLIDSEDEGCNELFTFTELFSPISNGEFHFQIPFATSLPVLSGDQLEVKVQLPGRKTASVQLPSNDGNYREQLIKNAKQLLGVPYQWGGVSSFGCDCSGFVQSVFKTLQFKLPRDSYLQYDESFEIDLSKAKKGDLLFFKSVNKIDHVGIALGDSKLIHSSGFVKIESLNSNDYDFNEKLSTQFYSAMSMRKWGS